MSPYVWMRRDDDLAVLIVQHGRLLDGLCAALDGELEGLARVIDPEGKVAHAITVFRDVRRDGASRTATAS